MVRQDFCCRGCRGRPCKSCPPRFRIPFQVCGVCLVSLESLSKSPGTSTTHDFPIHLPHFGPPCHRSSVPLPRSDPGHRGAPSRSPRAWAPWPAARTGGAAPGGGAEDYGSHEPPPRTEAAETTMKIVKPRKVTVMAIRKKKVKAKVVFCSRKRRTPGRGSRHRMRMR